VSLPTTATRISPAPPSRRAAGPAARPSSFHGRPTMANWLGAAGCRGWGTAPRSASFRSSRPPAVRQGDPPLVGVDRCRRPGSAPGDGASLILRRHFSLPGSLPEVHVLLFADRRSHLDRVDRRDAVSSWICPGPTRFPIWAFAMPAIPSTGEVIRVNPGQLRRIQLTPSRFDGRPGREFGADVVVQVLLADRVLRGQRPTRCRFRLGRSQRASDWAREPLAASTAAWKVRGRSRRGPAPSARDPFQVSLASPGSRSPGLDRRVHQPVGRSDPLRVDRDVFRITSDTTSGRGGRAPPSAPCRTRAAKAAPGRTGQAECRGFRTGKRLGHSQSNVNPPLLRNYWVEQPFSTRSGTTESRYSR